MKIYSIQSNNTNTKQTFKAYFVNDAKGALNDIWGKAEKSEALNKQVRSLSSCFKQHSLEIVDHKEVFVTPDNKWSDSYKILNHYTGKTMEYIISLTTSPKNVLLSLLRRINSDMELFENSSESELYRKLTGQE